MPTYNPHTVVHEIAFSRPGCGALVIPIWQKTALFTWTKPQVWNWMPVPINVLKEIVFFLLNNVIAGLILTCSGDMSYPNTQHARIHNHTETNTVMFFPNCLFCVRPSIHFSPLLLCPPGHHLQSSWPRWRALYCGLDRSTLNRYIYYTALLNAVERSIHFHGPSRLPVVNYFSIMTIAKHIISTVKESGGIHVFRITPQVVR